MQSKEGTYWLGKVRERNAYELQVRICSQADQEHVLGADQALAVDCGYIRESLFPNGFPAPYRHIEGFDVIQSQARLDVTAVYTVTGRDQRQSSIDVEQIRERIREG